MKKEYKSPTLEIMEFISEENVAKLVSGNFNSVNMFFDVNAENVIDF